VHMCMAHMHAFMSKETLHDKDRRWASCVHKSCVHKSCVERMEQMSCVERMAHVLCGAHGTLSILPVAIISDRSKLGAKLADEDDGWPGRPRELQTYLLPLKYELRIGKFLFLCPCSCVTQDKVMDESSRHCMHESHASTNCI